MRWLSRLAKFLSGFVMIARQFTPLSNRKLWGSCGVVMFSSGDSGKIFSLLILCIVLAVPLDECAAIDPRFEFDAKALGVVETPRKQSAPVKRVPKRTWKKRTSAAAHTKRLHTVRQADDSAHVQAVERMSMSLQAPTVAEVEQGEQEASAQFRHVWEMIVPSRPGRLSADILNDPSFSLTLDPMRYPTYSAMDGGRILVDKQNTIPPLVKALIVEKNPSVRIVAESPLHPKRFLREVLNSAGFYSVSEGFSMDFGADPQLTIRSDFKIEKTPESLVKFDMLLMTSGQTAYPKVLKDFLKNEGVTVYEPFAGSKTATAPPRGELYQITSRDQNGIVDALLGSLAVAAERNKRLDVFSAEDNGISLSVKAERYFERDGQRHIITRFDGDPVKYTLFRILQAQGYQTVILESRDDFRTVTEKLLAGMSIPGAYSRNNFDFDPAANYSLQMSGFKLYNPRRPGIDLFLTNLDMDRVVRELLHENGYQVTVK